MRVAALYDIHGNLPALRAVLEDASRAGVDAFVVGGDVVAGPLPGETLERLIALGPSAQFVRGNADREVVEAYDRRPADLGDASDPVQLAARFAASRLSRAQRDRLAEFAPTVSVDIDGLGPTLFCHGTPRSDTEIITRITPDDRLREILDGVPENLVVCGHVHQQFDRTIDGRRLVNAGSIGIPYEGERGAYWALLGPGVELRRTEYDFERALEELQAGGFPALAETFEESLVNPIDPDEVSAYFEGQAVGK